MTHALGHIPMFLLLLAIVLAVVVFGVVSAALGRGGYRWIALASGMFALFMLMAAALLLLGAGVVAIGTTGSLAQVLVISCVAGMAFASVLCIIAGRIALRRRGSSKVATE